MPIRSPATTRSIVPGFVEAEDVDRQPVVHAQRERGRVHHLEAALDRLEVRELGQEPGAGVLVRVTVVDAVDAVLPHQDRVRADLQGAQRGSRVRREERVAGARREDHDPALLEVADRAAADIGLGDLGHGDRGLDTRHHPNRSSASCRARALSRVASIPA